ncbi:MAG TPA: chromophore lyase CpcT/CpeT, partial [Thermoanaerobaculia bacterium]|nr:chromophore lyase CpcT/CpeT [Thermoanaerobaculia bacterium]
MSGRLAAAAVGLVFARAAVAAEGGALEVASWLTGTFESDGLAAAGATPEAVRIVVVAVPKSRIANGAVVVYEEQAVAPKLDEPSRQRFYRLEEDGDAVRMRAFDPKDPLIVRGKWRDPSVLALYGASDMRERPGCAILLRKSADRWEGGTQGAGCPSIRRTAATMTSALVVSRDGFIQWDRGFDEKGRQAWGSTEGGTRFVKRSAAAPVDDRLMERPVGKRAEAKEGISANGKEFEGAGAASSGVVVATASATDGAINLLGPYSPSRKI